MQTKPSGGFVVTFVVTGDGTGSFQTVNYDQPQKEKLFVLISINGMLIVYTHRAV